MNLVSLFAPIFNSVDSQSLALKGLFHQIFIIIIIVCPLNLVSSFALICDKLTEDQQLSDRSGSLSFSLGWGRKIGEDTDVIDLDVCVKQFYSLLIQYTLQTGRILQ